MFNHLNLCHKIEYYIKYNMKLFNKIYFYHFNNIFIAYPLNFVHFRKLPSKLPQIDAKFQRPIFHPGK